jgi:hypothetical protein
MPTFLPAPRNRLLAAILIVALALRVAMANGGIWMDEAWSAIFARHVGTPIGIFFGINHDNNHHLNTVWLQLTGMGAPSLVMRAPAILCGTIAVYVAARLARRDGPATMLATAALFAVSPFMVLYGSEARGYAPVTLALLCLLTFTRDWIDGAPMRRNAAAVATGLGMFSHMVMLPALVLVAGWAFLARDGLRHPVKATKDVFGALDLALITGVAIAFFLIAGAMTQGGLAFASYSPYRFIDMLRGVNEMAGLVLGTDMLGVDPAASVTALGLVIAVLALSRPWARSALQLLCVILVVAMPVAVVLLNLGNSQFGRYHLIAAIGLLLLIGNRIGLLIDRGGGAKIAGLAVLLGVGGVMLAHDRQFIAYARGAPHRPVEIMMQHSPQGASVLVTMLRSDAPLRIAAMQRHYRLEVDGPRCSATDYLLVTDQALAKIRPVVDHCDARWRRIAGRETRQLSGESWALYARQGLQTGKAVANGPPPAR